MTLIHTLQCAALASLMMVSSATAQTAQSVAVPLPPDCAARSDAIGLSRIVEIDSTGGPTFGQSQYRDVDFLEDGEVVLTFDDGPLRRYTMPILDVLDRHCTRATFFSVGRMALSDPATLKETARRGHTIATHTWSHKKLSNLKSQKAKDEIELGLSAVTLALGAPVAPFFRFPYLGDSKTARQYMSGRDISSFSIDIDSEDFRTRNPGTVLRTVMSQLKSNKKGIILFHDIQPSTAGALSSLIDDMKRKGFKIVHLVPKTMATTLPEYDATAQREAAKRSVARAEQPLADRAVTWPNAGGGSQTEAGAKPKTPANKTETSAAGNDTLPWSAQTVETEPDAPVSAEPPLAPSKRRPLWQPDDDPWRIRLPGE
jgi:peptidoglycan-N-acetylglucosamine deacetylase